MNNNQGIRCVVCGSKINIRMQAGNINKNIIRFNCPKCKIPINIVIEFVKRQIDKKDLENMTSIEKIKENMPQIKTSIQNGEFINNFEDADYSIQCSSEFFTSKKVFNPYKEYNKNDNKVPFELLSPFIQARSFFEQKDLQEFQKHCYRICMCVEKINIFERLNSLYSNDSEYFVSHINKIFSEFDIQGKCEQSNLSKIESIYSFNIRYFNNFLKIHEFSNKNNIILDDIAEVRKKNETQFNKLLKFFYDNGYLDEYEKKIIKIIDTYIHKFEYFLPAISLEYLKKGISKEQIYEEYTMRTCTFDDIRNIYLEVYENIIDIYSLFICLNNILYRNDYGCFKQLKELDGVPNKIANSRRLNIRSFDEFQLLNKGLKLYYIHIDEKFNKYIPKLQRFLRNSLGHESWSYDNKTQIINYRTHGTEIAEIPLLEYANECYNIFLKLVYIYKIIIDMKHIYLKNIK